MKKWCLLSESAQENLSRRDVFVSGCVIGTLALLLVVLLTGHIRHGFFEHHIEGGQYADTMEMLMPPELIAMVGFLVLLSTGAVNLAVWPVICLGALLAAFSMQSGLTLLGAIALPIFCGVVFGVVIERTSKALSQRNQGLSVTLLSAAIGISILLLFNHIAIGRSDTNESIFGLQAGVFFSLLYSDVQGGEAQYVPPLVILRVFSVFIIWGGLEIIFRHGQRLTGCLMKRPVVLSTSLCCLAGYCMMVERAAPLVPGRLLDDFRIPVAVILSGVIVIRGNQRLAMPVIMLPLCALAVSLWQMQTWPGLLLGYSPSLVVLGVAVCVIHMACGMVFDGQSKWRCGWVMTALLNIAGVITIAIPSTFGDFGNRPCFIIGTVVVTTGLMLFLVLQAIRLVRPRGGSSR